MSSGLIAPNEAGAASIKRLRDHLRWWGLESVFDAALRTERLRVVEQIRERLEGVERITGLEGRRNSFVDDVDLARILDAVAGLSGEEPSE